MKKLILVATIGFNSAAFSQVQDTTDAIDYSKFGDAEKVQRYCTPKILNQTPQKVWSVGFEYQTGFEMPLVYKAIPTDITKNTTVNSVPSFRGMVNIPVISKDKIVWQMGGSFYSQQFKTAANSDAFANKINKTAFVSSGINTTIFKPFNEKNFLIAQAQVDANGLFDNFSSINSKAFTTSTSIIYGWKKSDNNMVGFGLSRSYRAGRLMYFPVLLWNKTFTNEKWGMEILLPARGHVRYRPNAKNIFQLGYELEGNQFVANINNQDIFIQRGELKPRLMWDTKLSNYYWLNLQVGYRINWRFEAVDKYNGKLENLVLSSKLANPFYFGVNINFATP